MLYIKNVNNSNGDNNMNYTIFSKIMNKYFNNQTFHSPTDKVIESSKTIKKKYKYPCKIQEEISIDYHTFIFHHYNIKANKILLYFPGGSFIDPPTVLHYKYAKKIAKKLNLHVIMVQYPLFPEIDPYSTATLIIKILKHKNINDLLLMGDSAGANLACFVLQCLHDSNLNYVKKAILISPFIDKSLNNKKICLIRQYDFVLNYENCKALVEKVFKPILKENQNLFPDNNTFRFNSDILMISGQKEIFTPDIRIWCQNERKLNIKHMIYKDMCHCFPIVPCKQANDCIKNMKIFINKH